MELIQGEWPAEVTGACMVNDTTPCITITRTATLKSIAGLGFSPVIVKYNDLYWVSLLEDEISFSTSMERASFIRCITSYSCEIHNTKEEAETALMRLLMERS